MIVQKRGKNVALAGAVLQIAMSAVMLAIWLKTGSVAAMSATAFLACGTLLWLMAGLLFYCRQLKRREELEFQEITAAGATAGAIFEAGRDPELQPAANRLKFMMRWIVPSFTLFWAALAGTIAIVIIYAMASRKVAVMPQATVAAMFAVLTGFVGFLFSRYSVGMSDSPEWRLLRATGSYLTVNVLAIVAVAAALLVDPQGYVDHVVAFVIPVVQCILSVELLLNFILDLYRPRLPGQEDRVSFDSRLFNLVAQPGKIGHSLAEAINYQFGFEVSKTWFYQLLGKSLLPLIIFGILIMLAMSCIVVVENGERYVVTHLGQPQAKLLEPGINFKLPWPIDTARRFEVGKLQDIMLGVGAARTEEERTEAFVNGRELYLWTKEHGPRQEKDFVIASPPRTLSKDGAEVKSDAPPVNLIKLVVRIQYRITNPLEYGYNYVDAHKTLECLASGEMVRYCASATLDEPVGDSADRPEAIMTYGRIRTGE